MNDEYFLQEAFKEAKKGRNSGGIPIGSVLVYQNKVIGRGHNQRVQKKSVTLHGEMDALENAGRLSAAVYKECTLYTTLSPCAMCSGAIVLYGVPRVVIGENYTFKGAEDWLKSNGITLHIMQDAACIEIMRDFIEKEPELWREDIGE